jgi:hypothetical protein
MAMLGQLGNMTEVKVSNGFEPIPAGKYRAQVTETELKQTKAQDGQLLKAKFEILDGEFAGRAIFTNYNLVNKNKQAQEIGLGQLKALATYSGHPNPNMIRNSEELHNRPVVITVKLRPAKGEYDASNDIVSYESVGGQSATTPKPPAAPVVQAAQPVVAAAPSAPPVAAVAAGNAVPVAAPAAVQAAPVQPAVQHQATTVAAPGGMSAEPVGNGAVAPHAQSAPTAPVHAQNAAPAIATDPVGNAAVVVPAAVTVAEPQTLATASNTGALQSAADDDIPPFDPADALLQAPPPVEYVDGHATGPVTAPAYVPPTTPVQVTDPASLKAAAGF